MLAFVLSLGLAAIIGISHTSAAAVQDYGGTCVHLPDIEPCKLFEDGLHDVCGICHLGFFAECKDAEINVRNCPHISDEHGLQIPQVFNSATGQCELESDTCQLYNGNCVDLRDGAPCESFDDGRYDVCGLCKKGFFAECKDQEITVGSCPRGMDENGIPFNEIFDSFENKCGKQSSSCQEYEFPIL